MTFPKKNWNLERYDRATAMKLTKAVAFVRHKKTRGTNFVLTRLMFKSVVKMF